MPSQPSHTQMKQSQAGDDNDSDKRHQEDGDEEDGEVKEDVNDQETATNLMWSSQLVFEVSVVRQS